MSHCPPHPVIPSSQSMLIPLPPEHKVETYVLGVIYSNMYIFEEKNWICDCSRSTVCPRSSDPFYVVSYYINWVTTSWTYGIVKYLIQIKWQRSHMKALAWRKIGLFVEKKNRIYDCSRSNQMTYIDQMTEIAPYVCTCYLATI